VALIELPFSFAEASDSRTFGEVRPRRGVRCSDAASTGLRRRPVRRLAWRLQRLEANEGRDMLLAQEKS